MGIRISYISSFMMCFFRNLFYRVFGQLPLCCHSRKVVLIPKSGRWSILATECYHYECYHLTSITLYFLEIISEKQLLNKVVTKEESKLHHISGAPVTNITNSIPWNRSEKQNVVRIKEDTFITAENKCFIFE